MNQSGHEKPDFDVWGQKAPPKQQSGGRKRPQNVKVGAKSAPTIWTRQNCCVMNGNAPERLLNLIQGESVGTMFLASK